MLVPVSVSHFSKYYFAKGRKALMLKHWLGAYRTNALYSGPIFVRFNDLEDVLTCIVLSFYCLDLNHLVRVFYLCMFS